MAYNKVQKLEDKKNQMCADSSTFRLYIPINVQLSAHAEVAKPRPHIHMQIYIKKVLDTTIGTRIHYISCGKCPLVCL